MEASIKGFVCRGSIGVILGLWKKKLQTTTLRLFRVYGFGLRVFRFSDFFFQCQGWGGRDIVAPTGFRKLYLRQPRPSKS